MCNKTKQKISTGDGDVLLLLVRREDQEVKVLRPRAF